MAYKIVFNPFIASFQYVDSSNAQTFATGTIGSDFNIVTSGLVNTFNIPIAASSVTGKLDSADWIRFDAEATNGVTGVTDTSTIDLTKTGKSISAALRSSTASIPASGLAVILNTQSDGILPYLASSSVTGLFSASAPLVFSNGQYSIPKATTGVDGYLASGDFTTFSNKQTSGNYIVSLTGDLTASGPGTVGATLATVNSNTGSFGTATQVASVTLNGKGLVTAASNTAIQIAESQVTNLVTDLAGKQATGNYIVALTGDVAASGPGTVAGTIQSHAVTNSKMAQMAASTFKGNNTGSTADPLDLTVSQALTLLNVASIVPGDISSATASIGNTQSAQNVTGMLFANASVRSAQVEYSIFINATASLYEQGTLFLVQRASDWSISQQSTGDNSLVTFDISNAGQVTYSSSTYSGFTSGKISFRAFVTVL